MNTNVTLDIKTPQGAGAKPTPDAKLFAQPKPAGNGELTFAGFDERLKGALDEAKKARNEALSYYNSAQEKLSAQALANIQAAQNNLERLIRLEERSAKDPVRVLFMVPHTSLFDVFLPIYRAMSQDPLFQPTVLAFRRVDIEADVDEHETKAFFASLGIEAHVVGFETDKFYPVLDPDVFDILFYTLGSGAYPEHYRPERTSQFFLTCYLSYGFLLSDQYDYQFNQVFHHAAWRIFASTTREKEMYDNYCARIKSNTVVSGYPKFDLFRSSSNQNKDGRIASGLGKKGQERPRVIWAPHWTLGLIYPLLNLGSFDKFCMEMLSIFDEFSDIDFIYKPHPNLQYALEKTTFMNKDSYAIYLSMVVAKPNVEIWRHGDYVDMFANSAGMITDSSSFLAEYMPSGHPLLFLDRPDRALMAEVGEEIIAAYDRGFTADAIRDFLQVRIRDQVDDNSEQRRRCVLEHLEVPLESASSQIIAVIKEQLTGDPGGYRKGLAFDMTKQSAPRKGCGENAQRLSTSYWRRQSDYNYESLFPIRFSNQIAFTQNALFPHLNQQSHVIDIGCADGWHSCMVAKHCTSLVGYDLNTKFIDLARAAACNAGLSNCTFHVADALELDLDDQSADAVLLSGLTTCLIDDKDALQVLLTAANVLKADKFLLLKDTLNLGAESRSVVQPGYGAIYRSLQSYTSLVEAAGFEIILGDWIHQGEDSGSFMALAQKRVRP
jgi:2-polyprenyl-3-methyl-5-hydroxy-6-metoxy-1,4-benzoquinol methylase